MNRFPRMLPLSLLNGATPAREAACLRLSVPSSGIEANSDMAVCWPTPFTSTFASSTWTKAGTFLNLTCSTLPFSQRQVRCTRPAGVSSVSSVTGSFMGRIPVSRMAVTVQIVLEPDIGGYSVDSMMT